MWPTRRFRPLGVVWLLASAEVLSTAKRIEVGLSAGLNSGPTLQGEHKVSRAMSVMILSHFHSTPGQYTYRMRVLRVASLCLGFRVHGLYICLGVIASVLQGTCVDAAYDGSHPTPRAAPAHHPMWRAMIQGVFPNRSKRRCEEMVASCRRTKDEGTIDSAKEIVNVRGGERLARGVENVGQAHGRSAGITEPGCPDAYVYAWLLAVHVAGHGPEPPALVLGNVPISLSAVKVILQLLLTGLNVACWLVPMKVKRFSESRDLISMANAFSGGVFLSLAFGHMIPHSLDGFEKMVSRICSHIQLHVCVSHACCWSCWCVPAGWLDDACMALLTRCIVLPQPIAYVGSFQEFAHNIPFFVVLGGYLLIFFIEKIAFDTHGFIEEHHHHHHGSAPPTNGVKPAAAGGKAVAGQNGGANSGE